MAISISEQYPGKTAGNTTNYPLGEARNVTTPGDGTGTPWEQAIVNDDQGFKQALLTAAGITPSGAPDTAVESQYLTAIEYLISSAQPTTRDRYLMRFQGPSASIVKNVGGAGVVRLGVGSYEVTLPADAPDTDYMVFLTGTYRGAGGGASINLDPGFTQTKRKFRIFCSWGGDNTAGSYDPAYINVRIVY